LDGHNEGRSRGRAGGLCGERKLLGIVRHEHADQKDAENVEKQDSVEGEPDRARDRPARVLSLTDSHTDELSSQVGKCRRDHGGPERIESSRGPVIDVRVEGAWLLPVPEAFPVMVGSASQREDEGQEDEPDNDDDLERREPEFEFTEESNAKIVDADDQDQKYSDPHAGIDTISGQPVRYDERTCCQLIRCDNNVLEPISVPKKNTD